MDHRPIGVFDSGLGGLSALRTLEEILPSENFIYFGDSGRMPYGGRSEEEITAFTAQILRFLCEREVKLLVVGCGTISAVAMPHLAASCPVPFVDVITPASETAVRLTKSGHVGVLATEATVRSGAYKKTMLGLNPALMITQTPAPLLAPLVETGHLTIDDPELRSAVEESVAPLREAGPDTLILGCTHYPLIAGPIGAMMGEGVQLVSNGGEAAHRASEILAESDMLAPTDARGETVFYTTGDAEVFSGTAARMLGRPITVRTVNIEDLK
ncbi:MAG: glutamate racemase [Eubacteriales bacterium]|nr:glutamate racemase [Eubacteriales bacterium]